LSDSISDDHEFDTAFLIRAYAVVSLTHESL